MGRSKEADLCIKDINVSRRHAEFTWGSRSDIDLFNPALTSNYFSGGWSVANYSDNGIWVNKDPLIKVNCATHILTLLPNSVRVHQ